MKKLFALLSIVLASLGLSLAAILLSLSALGQPRELRSEIAALSVQVNQLSAALPTPTPGIKVDMGYFSADDKYLAAQLLQDNLTNWAVGLALLAMGPATMPELERAMMTRANRNVEFFVGTLTGIGLIQSRGGEPERFELTERGRRVVAAMQGVSWGMFKVLPDSAEP